MTFGPGNQPGGAPPAPRPPPLREDELLRRIAADVAAEAGDRAEAAALILASGNCCEFPGGGVVGRAAPEPLSVLRTLTSAAATRQSVSPAPRQSTSPAARGTASSAAGGTASSAAPQSVSPAARSGRAPERGTPKTPATPSG